MISLMLAAGSPAMLQQPVVTAQAQRPVAATTPAGTLVLQRRSDTGLVQVYRSAGMCELFVGGVFAQAVDLGVCNG